MEKKKLLLVSVSTGIFLMLVIGASILVFSPKNAAGREAEIASLPAETSETPSPVELQAPPENTLADASLVPQVSIISEEAAVPAQSVSTAPKPAAAAASGTRPVLASSAAPKTTLAAPAIVVETPSVPKQASASASVISTEVAVKPAATSGAKPASASTPATSSQSAQKPAAAKPAAAKPSVPAYWVQVGSYTQKSGADKVKQSLAQQGVTSIIQDNEVQGRIYYRVRVGPYVSQAEADYWRTFLKSVAGCENSQVWKSKA